MCDKKLKDDRDTHIDHDHKTGKIRSILCNKCNVGLGMFNDDTAVLRRAAKYIEKHELGGDDDWASVTVDLPHFQIKL